MPIIFILQVLQKLKSLRGDYYHLLIPCTIFPWNINTRLNSDNHSWLKYFF